MILTLLTYHPVPAQPRTGFEQYYCTGSSAATAPVSRFYYETAGRGYAEMRYNYDAEGCIGLSAGHRFGVTATDEKRLTWTVTPTVGITAGREQGYGLGANLGFSLRGWSFSSSVQVSPARYSYSWSELGVSLSSHVYLGAAIQQDGRSGSACVLSPGLTMQLSMAGWSLPVYVFNPFDKHVWLLVGLTREWVLHKSIDHPKKTAQSR